MTSPMQIAPSRSPSPISAPPIATAPGPRASALQKLYNDAIAHVLKTCSYSNFSACFPTPAAHVPGSVRLLHEQFTEKLGESMRREFESILQDRRVVPSLNEFDSLVEDARRRKARAEREGRKDKPVPPHTLPAQQLCLSHLTPSLNAHSQRMREQQDMLQSENSKVLERVMQQRKEIESLISGLEQAVAELDASVDTMQGDEGMSSLRDEVKDADMELRMIS